MRGFILVLIILMVLTSIRILIGMTIWDRLLGFNLITSKLVLLVVLVASLRSQAMFLDIALVFALFGFVGVAYFAKFLNWQEDKS